MLCLIKNKIVIIAGLLLSPEATEVVSLPPYLDAWALPFTPLEFGDIQLIRTLVSGPRICPMKLHLKFLQDYSDACFRF